MDVEDETAGSVAASESHNSSGLEPQEHVEAEESLAQQGGSVNWGQATAQSPRVPRSQISRAHPAHAAGAYGERTSAVLSALSGDDETALSAAEAAGEHTSEPQEAVGGVGEAGTGGGGLPGAAAGAVEGAGAEQGIQRSHLMQQQLPALSLTAPPPRVRGGFELASSPPACTSPVYRANSVVSYTAGPPKLSQHQQQGMGVPRRGAETPGSAPAAAQIMGASPNTSRGEFSAALPRAPPRRAGAFSSGLPPASGHRPGSAQHQQHSSAMPAGPSRPSLSGTQSHVAGAAPPLPSTMAVALGANTPPGLGLLGQLSPHHGALGLPTPQSAAGLAGLLPLAASMGLQPSQLGTMAAALMQAQNSVLGTQQQPSAIGQQQMEQQPARQGRGQAVAAPAASSAPLAAMPPPPPLQVLQQAEALQSMAAMLQAQASAIMTGNAQSLPPPPVEDPQQQRQAGAASASAAPVSGVVSPAATGGMHPHVQQQQQHQQQQPGVASPTGEAGHAQPAASLGAASVQSLPSLVGASAIQGHPLPPPTSHRAPRGATPPPLQSYGGTPAPHAAAAVPPTAQSGEFPKPGPPAAAATPAHAAAAASEMQASAIQPATAARLQHAIQQGEEPMVAAGPGTHGEGLPGPTLQAASAVQGSGIGGARLHRTSPSSANHEAAEAERRRHEADPPRPQVATIQETPAADVAAASQGGGEGPAPQADLPPAVPQDAAMLGGNSAFGDAMELGGDDEDAMEVQQQAAGGGGDSAGGPLPPAPHGAASVMATLMTDNGGGGRSEGDTEMEQQAASGPSRSAAGAPQPAQSLSRSMAEPAVATAHNTGAFSTHTAPSQQGPVTSNQGQVVHALSSLATVSTGNGERAGGSVEMSALPSQHEAQHATSAPAVIPARGGAPPHGAGLAAGGAGQGQEAASNLPATASPRLSPAQAQPAASAPAAVPPQAAPQAPTAAVAGADGTPPGALAAQPAVSVSMSGQGDTPGVIAQYGSATGGVLPQHSVAAAPAGAAGVGSGVPDMQHAHAQAVAGAVVGQPSAAPALASLCMGQNDGIEPMTDARSRRQPGGAAAVPPAPAPATIEGMGSPTASLHVGQPRESEGTARATILAGAAHSILTTAAAGEGEAMDEGGEALSPLLTGKTMHLHTHTQRTPAASQLPVAQGPLAFAADPRAGSAEGTPPLPANGVAASASAGGAAHPAANGVAKALLLEGQGTAGAAAAPRPAGSRCLVSPVDHSTMAVDLGLANGTSDQPQPSASGQPSSLPPARAVAAALAALEQQQAALHGSVAHSPLVPAELYHALQQNGYVTHANSAIGNGHIAQNSPERELTSPSRLLTHDSTGSGSHHHHSKQATKRRRTSVGPASSTQYG